MNEECHRYDCGLEELGKCKWEKGPCDCQVHKPDPREGGTDGTSEWLPVREADGPLVASVYSSPLPVRTNRFYHEPGGECPVCHTFYETDKELIIHLLDVVEDY